MSQKKLTQKTITHFLQEFEVPEEKKEKVIFAIADMIRERNEYVWHQNDQQKNKPESEIEEMDVLIKQKIHSILAGHQDETKCTDCFTQ